MDRAGTLTSLDLARAALEAVRARAWLFVLIPLVAVGGLATQHYLTGSAYQARVDFAFDPFDGNPTLVALGVTASPLPTGDQILSDATLNVYRNTVRRAADAPDPRADLRVDQVGPRQATLYANGDTEGPTRRLVADWARAFVIARETELGRRFNSARRTVARKLRRPPGELSPARRDALMRRNDQIDASQSTIGSDATIVRDARVTVTRAAASDYLLAAIAGLVVAGALALLLGVVDRRLRTPETMAAAFGLPLLGLLRRGDGELSPKAKRDNRVSTTERLHSRLLLASGGRVPPTIVLTSVDQKADVAFAGYAIAAAITDAGKTVALIGWHPGAGDQVATVRTEQPGGVTVAEDGSEWPDFLRPVAELSMSHDVVVVCAPSILDAADSLLAAEAMSAWFVCAQVGATRLDDALALQRSIDTLQSSPMGLIALGPQRRHWTRLLVEDRPAAG